MSEGKAFLQPTEDDITKLLMARAHIGSKNANFQMLSYVHKRKGDGTHIIALGKTWEKLLLAARVVAAVPNPKDVAVISGRPFGQRAVYKYAAHTGATPLAGRFTPGTFTNQIQKAFYEPSLLIVTDPRVDHQAVRESRYLNLPVIAFCNTDSPLRYVDVVIPVNNSSIHSIGLTWWLLAREVLRLRGSISRSEPWSIMVDLYFFRDPEAEKAQAIAEKEETPAEAPAAEGEWAAAPAAAAPAAGEEWTSAAPGNWGNSTWESS